MKIFLVPFGSYKLGESRDQDFVAFPDDAPEALVREAVGITLVAAGRRNEMKRR